MPNGLRSGYENNKNVFFPVAIAINELDIFTLYSFVLFLFVFLFLQLQGYQEHFQDTCGGEIAWVSSVTSYTAFLEGWALYAENPLIAYDTDTYEGEPLYKYGMLKSQVRKNVCL